MFRSPRLRKALRRLAMVLVVMFALVTLPLLALQFSAVRSLVLDQVVTRVTASLPGDLRIGRAAWPQFSTLLLDDIDWVASGDTLVRVENVDLRWDTGALVRRHLRVPVLHVRATHVDVPQLQQLLASTAADDASGDAASEAGSPAAVPWLREGAVPGVPSVWFEDARIDVQDCRLTDSTRVARLLLEARADLRPGKVPSAAVDSLRLTMTGPDLQIETGTLEVDPHRGKLALTVTTGDGSPWLLTARTDTSTPDVVDLQILTGPRGEEQVRLLSARGDLQRSGSHVAGVQLDATLRTPDVATLRGVAPLRTALDAVPDLQGLAVQVRGDVFWSPAWRVDLQTQLQPNAWLEDGGCRFVQRDDSLLVRDAAVALDGLQLRGGWTQHGAAQEGHVHLQVDGTGWLGALAPDVEPPEELAVDVRARLTRSTATPRWEARVRAAMRRGPTHIEDLLCQVASTDAPQDMRFHVQSRLQGWDVTLSGETMVADSVQVQLGPIVLRQAGARPLQPRTEPLSAPTGPTHVVWQKETGARIDALQLTGDLGDWRVDGRWSPSSRAQVAVRCDWPQPPAILLSTIVSDSLQRAQFVHDWPTTETPSLRLTAHAQPRDGGTFVTAEADLVLPGPRTFAFALPESVQVEDLDVVRGRLRAEASQGSQASRWQAELDLNDTAWLDSTGVRVHARSDSLFLDSLRLLWDGLDVHLSGAADTSRVALEGRMQWDASHWVARIPQARAASLSLQTHATWSIQGPPAAPDVDASLQAQVGSTWGGMPQLQAELAVRQGVVERLHLLAPEGLRLRDVAWDRLQLQLSPARSGRDTLSHLRVDLDGPDQELSAALRLDLPQASLIQADTLVVRVFDRDLVTTKPFRVQRNGSSTLVEDIHLQGSLGSLQAEAFVSPDSLDLLALADLQLPEQPDFLRVPAGVWPRQLQLRAAAAGNDSFSVSLRADGLQLATRSAVSLQTDVHADPDSTWFSLDIADPDARLLTAHGLLPLRWSLRPTTFALREDSLSLHAVFDGFPIPDVFEDPRTAVDYLARSKSSGGSKMHGIIDVDGDLEAPRVRSHLELQPQDPSLTAYRAHLFVALQQDDSPWSPALQEQLQRLSTADILRPPGAKMALWIQRDSLRVLDAAAHMPVQLGFRDGKLQIDSKAQLHAALRSRTLQLSEFAPLMPPRTSVGGTLNIDLRADGDWRDPQLEGGLRFADLSVEVPDGSRVRATGNIDVLGKASNPGVQGKVRVRDGLIRIPELPRSLLPTHGEALLVADSTFAWATPKKSSNNATAGTGAARERGSATRTTTADSLARRSALSAASHASDKDVFLEIPGAFWIRGRGFEVELSGQLQLTMRGRQLRVLGELKAERGGLQLLASKFPIKSGRVMFYGDDETNPSLDLIMGRDYGNVSVEVVVQGTAKDPKIDFRSDPQLSEDEILSYVLFGRGRSQLDDTQTSQFDDRALALASLLTSDLGEGIREQTGVDMIGLEQSADTADRASLVVGKYLSPRVLLKYVQDLERGRGYAVNVEYWLRGGLRLMTTTSRYDQSGMELNWSHDY